MTQITGNLSDSGLPLTGKLSAQLAAPLLDRTTTPNTVYFPIKRSFAIANGVVNINLPQSELEGISYEFNFYIVEQQIEFYYNDGTLYVGPTHQHSDTFWYTGTFNTADSVRLARNIIDVDVLVYGFHAQVPNKASVDYSQLIPTNFTTDRLSSGARQIASLLAFDQDYQAVIGDALLKLTGAYSSTRYYARREMVKYAGSSWMSLPLEPHINNTPADNSPFWYKFSDKGDAGGTGGQDTAYDATGWDGAMWAPSANAIRDKLETMATIAMLAGYASLTSPNFQGTPSRNSSPTLGDRTSQIPSCGWVGNEFATKNAPALVNPTATTVALTNYSDAVATTRWTTDYFNNTRRANVIATRTTAQALTLDAFTAILWNTEAVDSNNALAGSTYTVPEAGWYRFIVNIAVFFQGGTGAQQRVATSLYSGSSEIYRMADRLGVNNFLAESCEGTVNLAAGTAISIRIFAGAAGATSATIDVTQSFFTTRLVIERVFP